jgi:membrane protein implicated in regulation of membrane protease activity
MDAQLRDMVVAVMEAGDSDTGMVEILDEWATVENSTDTKEILLGECVEGMQVENLLLSS